MTYHLSLRRAAVDDMARAEAHYAAAAEGLDLRFRQEVASVLQRIEANPALYPISEKTPYRKAALRVFPFCVITVLSAQR
jgi:hypothetical protein